MLDIKLSKLAYLEVAAEIEDLLERVEEAAASSVLPAEPDHNWIEDFVAGCYRDAALEWRPGSKHTLAMASAEP